MANAVAQSYDSAECEFRKKNLWHSFNSSIYGAVGTAAFIGLLGKIVQSLVDTAASHTAAAGTAAASTGSIFALAPMLVMGGLMALGTFCVYMSQKEYTELRCLGDEHLARATAREKAQNLFQAPVVQQTVEHDQNTRADGQRWADVVRPNTQLPARA